MVTSANAMGRGRNLPWDEIFHHHGRMKPVSKPRKGISWNPLYLASGCSYPGHRFSYSPIVLGCLCLHRVCVLQDEEVNFWQGLPPSASCRTVHIGAGVKAVCHEDREFLTIWKGADSIQLNLKKNSVFQLPGIWYKSQGADDLRLFFLELNKNLF